MITTLPAPCWHQLPATAHDLDEYDPHFDTEAELTGACDDSDGEPVKAERYPSPCRTLSCDGCGVVGMNEAIGNDVHFPPGFEPDPAFTDFEVFGGRVLCEACKAEAERDELRKAGG